MCVFQYWEQQLRDMVVCVPWQQTRISVTQRPCSCCIVGDAHRHLGQILQTSPAWFCQFTLPPGGGSQVRSLAAGTEIIDVWCLKLQ